MITTSNNFNQHKMNYTVHLTNGSNFECGFYWINPQQSAFYYCDEAPQDNTPDKDILRGYYPISQISKVQVNEGAKSAVKPFEFEIVHGEGAE